MLQQEGVINDALVWTRLISDENRLPMMYNFTGTAIVMIQILLPFMILPIYSVMKTIPPSYMRAAQNLGAPPSLAFLRVYMPLTLPGVGAGVILVFIVAIGYYITPELVGGKDGRLIGNMIAYHMQKSLNWGLSSRDGDHSPCGDSGSLLGLRQNCWHRQLEDGLTLMALPAYATFSQRLWHYAYLAICAVVLFFLVAPLIVVIPLSFAKSPFLHFTPEFLRLDPEAFSLRWYRMMMGDCSAPDITTVCSVTAGRMAPETVYLSLYLQPSLLPHLALLHRFLLAECTRRFEER